MTPKQLGTALKTLFVAGLIFSIFAAAYVSQVKPEAWGHMAHGRELLKSFGLPAADQYSYTGGVKWDYGTWMFDAFLYSLSYLAGPENMKYFKAFLMLLVFFILFLVNYKRQQARYITAALPFALFGAFLLEPYFTALPQAMSLLFIACFLYVLERKPRKRNKALYWSLPAIALLWSNMHLSAFIGTGLMLVYLLYRYVETREEEAKKEEYDFLLLLYPLLAAAAAALLNPSLIKGAAGFFSGIASGSWFTGYDFGRKGMAGMFPFFVYSGLLLMIIVYNMKGADVGRRAELVKDSLAVLLFLALALKDAKYIPWFLTVSMPVISYYSYLIFRWDFVWPRQWAEADVVRVKNGFYFLLVPLVFLYAGLKLGEKPRDIYPSGAAAYISGTQVPKNLFSESGDAGFVEYFLYPEYKIMYDRYAKQPAQAEQDYGTLYYGDRGWAETAAKYGIGSALLRYGAPAVQKFRDAGYAAAYFDDDYVVLVDKKRTDRYLKNIDPLAEKQFDAGNTVNALLELESFADDFPSERAQLLTARVYAASGTSRAIDYLSYMIDKYPENYKLYNYKARLLYEAGDYENAYETLLSSAGRGPEEETMMKDIKIKLKAK